MKRIAILGSTGSIGRSTLSVVKPILIASHRYPRCRSEFEAAFEQARQWSRLSPVAEAKDADHLGHN